MDDDNRSNGLPGAEVAEEEYELEADDTQDLDDAMREALQAVERSESELEIAAQVAEPREDEVSGEAESADFARLQAELADLRDRSVRTLADFDNYRKRVARERRDELRYAAANLARELLAVVDNLERALASEGSAEDLKQGVAMVHKQLIDVLRLHGVERVEALGETFDPTVHEAVARFEDDEVDLPTVREEMQSGYVMHERLLRPSMVKVAMPVNNAANGEQEEAADED